MRTSNQRSLSWDLRERPLGLRMFCNGVPVCTEMFCGQKISTLLRPARLDVVGQQSGSERLQRRPCLLTRLLCVGSQTAPGWLGNNQSQQTRWDRKKSRRGRKTKVWPDVWCCRSSVNLHSALHNWELQLGAAWLTPSPPPSSSKRSLLTGPSVLGPAAAFSCVGAPPPPPPPLWAKQLSDGSYLTSDRTSTTPQCEWLWRTAAQIRWSRRPSFLSYLFLSSFIKHSWCQS